MVSESVKLTLNLLIVELVIKSSLAVGLVTSFFRTLGTSELNGFSAFLKIDKTDLRQIFFQDLEKTFHYSLH